MRHLRISELIRGLRDIKVLNINPIFIKKLKQEFEANNKSQYQAVKTSNNYNLFMSILSDLQKYIFIILGIALCLHGHLTIAGFIIIYNYQNQVSMFLTITSIFVETLKEFNLSCHRVFEIIDSAQFQKETFGQINIPKIEGNFKFQNVNFSYDKKTQIINNLNFNIKANETVAFVGKSGGGKTTIFNLLNKLYTINDGQITIDNVNINNLTKDSIRNNMSIITQNPYIFNMSIKDNLKLVKPNMTDDEMYHVCKLACLHDFIITLNQGYDTIVGENGVILSGGQRQRLAIARALLKKTEIILFDEATSSLDNETQQEIQTAIQNMKGEYTILIIAHRLSTIIDADRIIIIDNGHVIATGTHKQLLQENKFYQQLYEQELK